MTTASAISDSRFPIPAALLLALLLACAAPPVLAQSDDLSPEHAERYQALVNELRCLVCQNQSIADSNAPLAADLRDQVRAQILAGRSDSEIMEYVTSRYGDFVLYRPPFKPATWLLWIGPFVLLVLGLGIAAVFVRRASRAPAGVSAPDDERLRKLLDEDSR